MSLGTLIEKVNNKLNAASDSICRFKFVFYSVSIS